MRDRSGALAQVLAPQKPCSCARDSFRDAGTSLAERRRLWYDSFIMLMIRLQRFGKKNQPSFRVVVTDKRNSTKSGKTRETIGWYNPREHTHSIEKERVLYWLSQGAQASGTVHNMLVRNGVIKAVKIDVSPKKKSGGKKEEVLGEKTSSAEAPTEAIKEDIAPKEEVAA